MILMEGLELLADRSFDFNVRALDELYTLLNISTLSVGPPGGRRHPQQEVLQVTVRSVSMVVTCVLPFAFSPRAGKGWHLRDDIDKTLDIRKQLVQCGFAVEFVDLDLVVVCNQPTREDLVRYLKERGESFSARRSASAATLRCA